MKKIISHGPRQTFTLGQRLARALKGGEIIALVGELGAGKTTLVKGIAAGLGIRQPILSPTFMLMRIYPVKGQRSMKRLVHIDAYRVKHAAELLDIGVADYLGQPDTVTIIEWAERIKTLLPRRRTEIAFRHGKTETRRRISFRCR